MTNPKIQIIDYFFKPLDNWFRYNLKISSFFFVVLILCIEFILLLRNKSKETKIIVAKILSLLMILLCSIMGIIDTVKIHHSSNVLKTQDFQIQHQSSQKSITKYYNGEEWYCEPKSDTDYRIIPSNIIKIKDNYENYAIDLLAEKNFIVIDDELSELLIGEEKNDKEILILVRGVAYITTISDFIVLSDNENLIIAHKSKRKTKNLYKCPIIISVDKLPKNIYSLCK